MRSTASIKSHPIHPMLVSFPIGLWTTAFIFDLIAAAGDSPGLRAAGFYCVIAGCIGAVAAAAPGILDWLTVIPPNSSAKSRGLLHGGLNVFCLILFTMIAYRLGSPSSQPDKLTLFLMAMGVAVLGASSWLGGTLVFRNQIGVDHRYAGSGKFKTRTLPNWSRPACHQSELGDGQMLLANVGTERVVIGRCSEGLFAFGDSCTHKGGPLSDGALVGCTVQCPWHGSQFDVRNGRVIAGPAEEKIKIYSIETRNGEVYVKLPQVTSIEPKKAA
jgi:nitrite reductase/ring-hydroxylating ferredoxin subunit/uncharacterized membrane protein